MATARQWIAGARPRTLSAAVSPIAVGGGVAYWEGTHLGSLEFATRIGLALVVAVAMEIGVNFANDYSDGIRGTDDVRSGPVRLVGQNLALPGAVKRAAWSAFVVACAAGIALTLITQAWWLIAIGAAGVAAGWLYTGGPRPYGYAGLGELIVFVFFGVAAVTATTYVCIDRWSMLALILSLPVGLLACALLVVNNLRDIETDRPAGKVTLAVRLGDRRTRRMWESLIVAAFAIIAVVGVVGLIRPDLAPYAVLPALLSAPLAVGPLLSVQRGASGRDLVQVLGATGRLQLVFGLLLAAGLTASGLLNASPAGLGG
ncbi:MAG: 1,4-dihydroxy-2-naphthoate polyprenyltransferase [Candidatus Nanopelagicales bacterium]|nr:1,4-dihydroxy-2-naphthoate polyprenyltransferase [Candidatus Nanopelagicales bacterium]